jgi:hypothetical protein
MTVNSQPALLTRTEIEWLLGNYKPSKGQERYMRYCINKKLQTFQKLELLLLTNAGYASPTNVSVYANAISARTNAPRGSPAAAGCGIANPAGEVHDIREEGEEDGAGSGTFVPPSGSISNPRVLSDMGLAIPRPTRLGDPRPHLKQLQLTLY